MHFEGSTRICASLSWTPSFSTLGGVHFKLEKRACLFVGLASSRVHPGIECPDVQTCHRNQWCWTAPSQEDQDQAEGVRRQQPVRCDAVSDPPTPPSSHQPPARCRTALAPIVSHRWHSHPASPSHCHPHVRPQGPREGGDPQRTGLEHPSHTAAAALPCSWLSGRRDPPKEGEAKGGIRGVWTGFKSTRICAYMPDPLKNEDSACTRIPTPPRETVTRQVGQYQGPRQLSIQTGRPVPGTPTVSRA